MRFASKTALVMLATLMSSAVPPIAKAQVGPVKERERERTEEEIGRKPRRAPAQAGKGATQTPPPAPPVAPGALRARYRVTLNGFAVRRQTYDHALELDGKGDEVYFVAGVYATNARGERLMQSPKITTPVYGDVNGFPQRVRAGSRSAQGGLQSDDAFPEERGTRGAAPGRNALPLVLWDGEIVDGETVVYVIPSVWEYDNGDPLVAWETMWAEWTDTLTATAKETGTTRGGIGGKIQRMKTKLARALGNAAAKVASTIDKAVGTAGDRPVGMARSSDGRRIAFEPQVLELTYETAEQVATSDLHGRGKGVVEVEYDDASNTGGRYTLYLQVERMP